MINDTLTDIRTEISISVHEQLYVLINVLKTETGKAFIPFEVL